ncbi:MAG: tyrosine-type recombinase/integrase, partial [Proteobacteria bacterium]|nr:tyrosine-type recombinase/integrase [Pseudomonadota bacterium]
MRKLKVKDIQSREGVLHFLVNGKGGKIRYVPVQPMALRLIEDYLIMAGHREELKGPLFRPVKNNRTGKLNRALDPNSIYQNIVRKYGVDTGLNIVVNGLCVHAMRATAATNALSHEADISRVQEWLGHANVSTTRLYDRRNMRPE